MADEVAEVEQIIRQVVKGYRASCWWADERDLVQEAKLNAIIARGTWDPKCGVPLGPYVYAAVAFSLRKMLYRQSYAAHVSEKKWGKPGVAGRGVSLEAITALQEQEGRPLPPPLKDLFSPPTALERKRWVGRVVAALERALAPCMGEDAALAIPVLTGEERPQEVADKHGVKRRRVQKITNRARTVIRGNRELRKLWEELP